MILETVDEDEESHLAEELEVKIAFEKMKFEDIYAQVDNTKDLDDLL